MKNKIFFDCTKSSYALRPTRGNALLFFNLHPNTTPDQSSSHARCPVLDGDMWFATKFFHVKASDVQTLQFQADDSDCTDEKKVVHSGLLLASSSLEGTYITVQYIVLLNFKVQLRKTEQFFFQERFQDEKMIAIIGLFPYPISSTGLIQSEAQEDVSGGSGTLWADSVKKKRKKKMNKHNLKKLRKCLRRKT
ncbi:hypothetical protein RJ640_004067 [Escallonia rubra]|uniref:Small ribosomal subunit protein mS38 n=1 Tax=Escallonia rubra TaxID=112253 RepID=A0AA88UAH2_9ASTE|nr:hypothetical protein RJ640_004067 [Escallonia rubra]